VSTTAASLRALAFARTLGPRTTLPRALRRLGYVQADPIQSPARAQDLILMQRVEGYRAGDLERRYPKLDCAEDRLHNYGFIPRSVQRLLHPRPSSRYLAARLDDPGLLDQVLEVVRQLGEAHPRDVEATLGSKSSVNFWGGKSSETTKALESLLYRGDLRVARREKGIRVFAPSSLLDEVRANPLDEPTRARGLVELLVRQYAPLPEASLRYLLQLCGYGAPGLKVAMRTALKGMRDELESAQVDGLLYLWPADEDLPDPPREVRLVAPFDPLVWDRRRFEHLHGWDYRFEAYTPEKQRRFGYYALPLFWGDRAVGWANLRLQGEELHAELGFHDKQPRSREFSRALDEELERHRLFLR